MGYIFYGLLGLLVGGIINVLADDLPARRRIRNPQCPQCEHRFRPVRWLAITRRHCPSCRIPERRRTVIVELGTALTFAFLWGWYDGRLSGELLAVSFFFSVFILIFITDMEHRLILHIVTFPSIAIALLASSHTVTFRSAILGAAVGFAFFLLIHLLGGLVYGSGAMGFGDVTLSTFLGAAVGFPLIIVTLISGILAGGVVSIFLIVTKLRRLRSYVPYGPFLLIGGVVTLLWGDQIIAWYLR